MGMATYDGMSTADYTYEIERLRGLLGECWEGLYDMGRRYRECFDLDDLFSKLKEFAPKEEL